MRSTFAVTALVAAVALGGCLSASQPPVEALQPAAFAHVLDFAGCAEQLAILPTPMGDLQALVPEGFAVVPFDPLGLFGVIAGITFSCGNLTGMAEEPDGVREMTGVIVVAPPEELRADGIDTYAIPIGTYTSSQDLADLYAAWDLPVSVDDVQVMGLDLMVARASVAAGSDPNSTVTILSASALPSPQAAGTARVFGVRDGLVTGAIDFAWTESQGLEGVSVLLFEDGMLPIPLPAPGLGFHYWADDYAYHLQHKPLALLLAEGGSAAPVDRAFGVPMPQAEMPSGELVERLLAGA